jgi:hypothetical protein
VVIGGLLYSEKFKLSFLDRQGDHRVLGSPFPLQSDLDVFTIPPGEQYISDDDLVPAS